MSIFLRLVWILEITVTFRIGIPSNRIVDHFTYIPRSGNETENENEDVEWEFFVIGRRVPWNEAQAICSIYGRPNPLTRTSDEEMGHDALPDLLTRETETDTGSTLAVLDGDRKDWLARMVSESNYRYDGLWIGGRRKDFASAWNWIDTRRRGETLISDSLMVTNHPAWYVGDDYNNGDRNCLMFDRLGHDSALLVPENCRHRKPFVCMRAGKRKARERIIEGSSVFVDDQRYTLYQILDEDEDEENLRAEGVRKVDGGGVAWRDARLECKKRRKQLAMIFTNEAATAIASAMLKSRPSMESVWLDGRSLDGTDWTWASSGFTLSSKKSNVTSYPPWLDGHPAPSSLGSDDLYRRERCLILDRHLCARYRTPVFLDLDCEKKRPFVCQDTIPEHRMMENAGRSVSLDDKRLIFSFNRMTWKQGEAYCRKRSGRVASILDAKTLTAVLEKMTELALDHTWVGGHTVMYENGWKWVDENGEILLRNAIGNGTSWCFDEDEGSWPYTDREICLNLDRESHDMALFYGLPCNTTSQYVLCNLLPLGSTQSTSAMMNETTTTNEAEVEESIVVDVQEQATDLAGRIRKLAKDEQSGLLFVMDDSLSVLNAWFAEQMKLAATVIRRYFPLSRDHQMGLITFSENAIVALDLNQTDTCNVLSTLSKDMLANRATRISQDLYGAAGKTTDLINAALMSADVVRASGMQRVIVVFVTDGEHIAKEKNRENLQAAIDNLQNLRNNNHEAFAIVISQGQKHAADYNVIKHLFSTSLEGQRNLYFVEDYNELAKMNFVLNSTGKDDYAVECGEVQWTIPQEDKLLTHLLLSKK